ncbi:hypothetical protein RN001_003005 [Aquatica leii]|uniref:SAM domain-containing protein n=1 Tax=Aquatica leii TaxID=1421715 RepID=A0AAN7PHP4_9COLE|nr:hypothetical protein RN001_003005 [Aquatica leii]
MEHVVQMRDLSEFCEQLGEMQRRFCKLDSCERTIALYYLMVGLPFANARFLQRALEEAISKVNTPESQMLERNANDPTYISNFLTEAPHIALSKMLSHIPLLRPGNKEALKVYTGTLRRILSEYIAPTYKIYNECVEILSYVFVHPAFGREEKKSFRHLLYHVLQPNSPKNLAQSVSESSDESVSPNPEPTNYFSGSMANSNRLNRRSNSLTPGQAGMHENWSSQENLVSQTLKPRSYSLSNDKSLPLKSCSIQTSSSETKLQELQAQNTMLKGIVCWLKSLRLHKYSWVFNNLNYEQMLNLTELDLESMGITKGARHKLLLSIAKLKERSQLLTELETEVMNGGDLITALKKLKSILQSPLQTTSGENLPSQFVKVMGKVCTQILMLRQPSDDCIVLFSSLCERADASEAFTDDQKKRLSLWRGQMTRGNHIPIYNHRHQSNNTPKQQNIQSQHYKLINDSAYPQMYTQKSSSYPNMQGSPIVGAHRHSLGSTTLQNQLYNMNSQFCTTSIPQCSKNDIHNTYRTGYDKNSLYPQHNDAAKIQMHNTQGVKSSDIESSLESLCLQMMEHALGP